MGEANHAARYRDLSAKVADAYCSVLTDGHGKLLEEGRFTVQIQVPVGTTCELTLPDGTSGTYGSGRHTASCAYSV